MLIYPIVFSLIAFLAIIYIYNRVYSNKSPAIYLLWGLIWVLIIIFAFIPELSTPIASLFGIARGLDFLVIVAIILLFYLIFKIYMKVDKFQHDLTNIVREVALKNEIIAEDEQEEE